MVLTAGACEGLAMDAKAGVNSINRTLSEHLFAERGYHLDAVFRALGASSPRFPGPSGKASELWHPNRSQPLALSDHDCRLRCGPRMATHPLMNAS